MSEDEAPREAAWQTALKAKGLTKGKAWVCASCGTENLVRDPRCKLCSEQKPINTEGATTTTKARKWEMKEDKKFQFDFNSKPHPDINNICWAECEGVMKSAGGSGGVYFVATPVGALVVKCSMTLFPEVFGSALGDAVGLKTSKCRVLAMDNAEGDEMFEKLCALDKLHNGTGIIRADLQVKHVLIYAFAPGTSLETEQACESLLGPSGGLTELGLRRLQSIGQVMAFDMLCHNTDRLPLVSDNDGNVGNLLLSTAPGASEVVLIDTAVACVDPKHADTLGRYLDVCSRFLLKLFAAPNKPALNVLRVRDSIMEVTSFDIDARPIQEDGGWRARMSAMEKKAAAQAVQAPGSFAIQQGVLQFLNECKVDLATIQRVKASISPADLVGSEMVREDYFVIMLKLLEKKGDMGGLNGVQFIQQVMGGTAR